MQPLDSEDKRPTSVRVAASIRAAILTGEFAPGSQLPTGNELADFFGVSRMTVHTAIRVLRDEGFVRSRAGSGVYVQGEVSLPVPHDEDHSLAGVASFLFEAGHLKNLSRAGWLLLGISQPETVAEHSFRVGIAGIVLATMEGADIGRVAALGLVHDVHETRIGDVPSVGRAYVNTAVPQAVSAHQTSAMPEEVAAIFGDLVAEYEAGETLEAQVAKDADKIETLLQAVEYDAQGHDTAPWRETSIAALRTASAKHLAQAISQANPHHWWEAFAASYHELRATSRGTRAALPAPKKRAGDGG